MPAQVDGALRLRAIFFQHKHSLIGPVAVFEEIIVIARRHEDVCEHQVILIVGSLLRVAHAVTSRQKHPFAVTFRAKRFPIRGKFRFSCGFRRTGSCDVRSSFNEENCQQSKKRGQVNGSGHWWCLPYRSCQQVCRVSRGRYRTKQTWRKGTHPAAGKRLSVVEGERRATGPSVVLSALKAGEGSQAIKLRALFSRALM